MSSSNRTDHYPVRAKCTYGNERLNNVVVLNPGNWFGKCWLIGIGGAYTMLWLIVEADSASDAIDELADNEHYSDEIVVADDDLGDYPEDSRSYAGNSGKVIDTDWLDVLTEIECSYFGEGLPTEGCKPDEYDSIIIKK